MGLIPSEPIEKEVKIPKLLMEMPVEDAKNKLFFFLHAQYRGSRSTKTEKTKKKQAEAAEPRGEELVGAAQPLLAAAPFPQQHPRTGRPSR
jgi:hypothetical protein